MNQSPTSSLPPPTPTPLKRRVQSAGRREAGSLLSELSRGQEQFYDGAWSHTTIASRCGPRGPRVGGAQAYSNVFRSKVPKPWNRPQSREQTLVPVLGSGGGPMHYNPFGTQSLSDGLPVCSGSLVWARRGRTGPIGSVNQPFKPSPFFTSNVPRKSFAANPPPKNRAMLPREDCFVLKSDYRRESLARGEFHNALQLSVSYGQLPLQRTISAPHF